MALPYKLFKTITIDGETMGLDPDLGQSFGAHKNAAITTAYERIQGATLTINEPGTYYISARWIYGAATATGTRIVYLILQKKTNGSSSWTPLTDSAQTLPGPGLGSRISFGIPVDFSASDVPAQMAVFGYSDKVSTAEQDTSVYACKLVNTANLLGG